MVSAPSSSEICANAQLQELASASSNVWLPCTPVHLTLTPLTSILPAHVKRRLSMSLMFSIAAAEVMSLKMEPGVNEPLMQRLMYAPSGTSPSLLGSMLGPETMHRISPVL